jgi:hypothetical protein
LGKSYGHNQQQPGFSHDHREDAIAFMKNRSPHFTGE